MVQREPGDDARHANRDEPTRPVATVDVSSGVEHWAVDIRAGRHELVADEPPGAGGADAGPSPFALLLSGLGACTVMTLQMYAERKGWALERVEVRLAYAAGDGGGHIDRHLRLTGALDDGQRDKLADIAERTPVTLAVKDGVSITTTVA